MKVFIQVLDVFDDYRGAGAVKSKPTQPPPNRIAKPELAVHRGVRTMFAHQQQVEVALIAINDVAFDIAVVDPIARA